MSDEIQPKIRLAEIWAVFFPSQPNFSKKFGLGGLLMSDCHFGRSVKCQSYKWCVSTIKKYSWLRLMFNIAVWQWIIFNRTRPNPTHVHAWSEHFGPGSEVSGHFGTNFVVPKCLVEVSGSLTNSHHQMH